MRPSFSEAVSEFRQFLKRTAWSDSIRWISAADITGYRNRFWIFRPAELANEKLSEAFYDTAIATPSSVRLDALFQHQEFTLAWVADYGGDSQSLNYGINTSPWTLTPIASSPAWHLRRTINCIRGESPILRHTTIPEFAS